MSLQEKTKPLAQETWNFYENAYNWLVHNLPGILIGLVVLFMGLWIIKVLSRWFHSRMHKHDVDPSLKPFLLSLSIIGMRILLVLGVMQIMGIQMTIFAALVGAFGVAAGLALSGTLQNFASGILILLLKPFRVGDNIVSQGTEGTVTSIEIFYTVVTTFDNRTVVIPNSKLSNEVIVNISLVGNRRLDIELKFDYGVDVNRLREIANKAIDESVDILTTPERRIGIANFEADKFTLAVNVWLPSHGFQDKKLIFQEKLLDALKKSEIKLPGKEE